MTSPAMESWRFRRTPSIDRTEDMDKISTYFKELFGRDITEDTRKYFDGIRKELYSRQHPEYQPAPRHPEIRWHEHTQEWYCIKCGRTSDHTKQDDAWIEINAFGCEPPTPDENSE